MGKQKVFIRKKIRKTPYVLFYTYLLIVLMSLFTVASYTWFTMSASPQVNKMNVYITSSAGLKLAARPDAAEEEWRSQLDIFSTKELQAYQGLDENGEPKEKPSLYQTTWSDSENAFYGPIYGFDGRLMHVISWFKLDDDKNANEINTGSDHNSYYIKATLYARCDQPTDVTLAEPMKVDDQILEGSGTYVIGDPNTGKGPETAVRVGFRMTYVDSAGNELSETSPMFIYEPNIDRHADGSMDYIPTYSIHDLENQLVTEERLIKQTFSRRNEPGEFLANPTLFSIKSGEIMKIELYLWLEGQDVDCSNLMSDGVSTTKIEANIQFTGTSETTSGMVTIE